jgi:hypothetical protein
MDIKEGATRIAESTFDAMKSTPLAISLLVLNAGFLFFGAWILGQVAETNRAQDKAQFALLDKLITDLRGCQVGPKP